MELPTDMWRLIILPKKLTEMKVGQIRKGQNTRNKNGMIDVHFEITPTSVSINLSNTKLRSSWCHPHGYYENKPLVVDHYLEIYIVAKKIRSFVVLECGGLVSKLFNHVLTSWNEQVLDPYIVNVIGAIRISNGTTFGSYTRQINGQRVFNVQCRGTTRYGNPCCSKTVYGGYCTDHKSN